MAYGRVYAKACGRAGRACCALLAGGLLLAGCSGGGDGGGKPGAAPSASDTKSPSSGATSAPAPTPAGFRFTPDPARQPKTRADAKRLALAVLAGPDSWGPDYVKGEPYLSVEDAWPVLPANCRWESAGLPSTVLYTVTAHSEVPAAGGKGLVRVTNIVTVHRSVDDADWEMSETLEEALRCPDQTLREGERITGLMSLGNPSIGLNVTAEDAINELGKYVKDGVKGEHYYGWAQSRIGQVTVAASVRGGPGRGEQDLSTSMAKSLVAMLNRVEAELEVQS
ncbi:hypothetical protein [Streptomyces venezuelae]|uniref:hypothetical protein n=1 Tax=Streptomyces venezuelae TaxID=54571 RepID=UPI00278C4BB2|nr:hypothetical protein [Streptomyces venezuelae]